MKSMADSEPVRVAILDDDAGIRELLCPYLAEFGMLAMAAADGAALRHLLTQHQFDLVILDLMLPGESGLSLCRELAAASDMPILILTARGEMVDRIVGLELGADDYLVKPFEPRELVARIQTVLRRVRQSRSLGAESQRGTQLSFAGWQLDRATRQLLSANALVVPLSNAEYRLLSVFIERPFVVLSREQLLEAARGRGLELFDRSIDLLVSRLRHKLNDDPKEPHLIKTVRGEGYQFNAKVNPGGLR